jgi:Tol biopolymer transport system component
MSPKGWKTYRDFFLKIEPAGQGLYRVEAQSPAGGEGKGTFVLPFDEKDLEIFLLKIGRPRRLGTRGLVPQPTQPALDFGNRLFDAVFKGEVRDVFVSARNEAESKDYGLRLRLKLVGVPELADLPWEYLYDSPDFLALSTATPLVRYIDLPSPPRPLLVGLPLRILVTVSSPNGLPELDIAEEQSKIRNALAGLIKDRHLELEFSQDATLQTLQRTLRQASSQGRPFHAWHFIGHGIFDPTDQTGKLAICDAGGLLSPTDGFQLGTLFKDYPEMRLVLLNACEGARNSRHDPFAGVATALVERGIPAVIGMQFEISDEAAIVFSEGFYTALVDGLPVDAALTEARRSVFFMPNWLEWATPVLFMRSPDGILFKIQRRPSRQPAENLPAHSPEQEQMEKERAAAALLAIEKAEDEKLAAQKAEQERLEQEKAEAERLAAQKAEQERLEQEKAEAERLAAQKAEQIPPRQLEAAGVAAVGQTGLELPAYEKPEVRAPGGRGPAIRLPRWTIWIGLLSVGCLIAGFLTSRQLIPWIFTIVPSGTAVQFPEVTGRIAFVSDRDGNLEIYIMKADGSDQTNLTNFPQSSDEAPAWSPDGSLIAFTSDRDGDDEIYVMNADGSGQTNLTDNAAGRDAAPNWSPDGSMIAFYSDRGGNDEIYVMNADGSDQTRLTDNYYEDYDPTWSHDGSRIAFVSNRDGDFEIYVMNADGSEQTRWTDNSDQDSDPTWSPDDSRIAFESYLDSIREIYVMNADGSEQTQLTHNSDGGGWSPAWSPDSLQLAFVSQRGGNYLGGYFDIFDIYVINADGSDLIRLTDKSYIGGSPAWSPDGSWIAFVSHNIINTEIHLMNSEGSKQTRLTHNFAGDWDPAWQP